MPNREFDTRAKTKPIQFRQTVETKTVGPKTQRDLFPRRDPLSQVSSSTDNILSASAHASMLSRATAGRPSRAGQPLLQLQRQYGNRYVQRVLALARKGRGEVEAAPELEESIQRARGGGQALDSEARAQMEPAFGADFSGVRVHADARADTLNRELNARAFTTGQDIFFRQGAYNPGSSSGRELLAHELTHVVQQTGGVRCKLTVGQAGDKYEQEADHVARAVMQQEQKVTQRQPDEGLVRRQTEEEEEEEPVQAKAEEPWIQREVEPKELQAEFQDTYLHRQRDEEEEPVQAKAEVAEVHRQVEEEEEEEIVQTKAKDMSIHRQMEEEEEEAVQTKPEHSIQPQIEEEEQSKLNATARLVQRQVEEGEKEEGVQTKLEDAQVHRQTEGEEEEMVQAKLATTSPLKRKYERDDKKAQALDAVRNVAHETGQQSGSTGVRLQILSPFHHHNTITSLFISRNKATTATKKPDIKGVIASLSHYKILILNNLVEFLRFLKNYAEAPESALKTAKQIKTWKRKVWKRLTDPHIYRRYKEAGRNLRGLIVLTVGWSRDIINSLAAKVLGVTKRVLLEIKSYYHRLINTYTPYYTQMANINFLWKGGSKAWRRTCNVTSMSMVLNALGVSPGDFTGDRTLLTRIGTYHKSDLTDFSDLTALRMPDFLQLVVIYIKYQTASGTRFEQRAGRARKAAAKIISRSLKIFEQIAHLFKVKKTKTGFIPSYGAQKKALEKKINKKKQKLRKKHNAKTISDTEFNKQMSELNRQLQDLPDKLKSYTARKYKQRVMAQVGPLLNAGGQIVVNRPGHYVRLEGFDKKGIIIDDPASKGKNFRISWTDANNTGYFRSYVVFTK